MVVHLKSATSLVSAIHVHEQIACADDDVESYIASYYALNLIEKCRRYSKEYRSALEIRDFFVPWLRQGLFGTKVDLFVFVRHVQCYCHPVFTCVEPCIWLEDTSA